MTLTEQHNITSTAPYQNSAEQQEMYNSCQSACLYAECPICQIAAEHSEINLGTAWDMDQHILQTMYLEVFSEVMAGLSEVLAEALGCQTHIGSSALPTHVLCTALDNI